MSQHDTHEHHDGDHEHHGPGYWKVYWILLVLFIISVLGPEMARIMEMSPTAAKITVLVTAFGIAFVKAYFVIAYFMHLKFEIKYVQYMLGTTVVFMLLFFSAVAPDVMRHDGACQRWAEVEGKKVCKIYSWTNSAAAAEVVYAATIQANEPVHGKPGSGKVAASQSDEWAQVGPFHGGKSRAVHSRDKMVGEKRAGLHRSFWYDKAAVSSNQLADPKTLHLTGEHTIKGIKRVYEPIASAMKNVVTTGARPLNLPSKSVVDTLAPKPAEWAAARVKFAQLMSKPLPPFQVDGALAKRGADLFAGRIKVGGNPLPCNSCHSVDGSDNTGPTLKGFYGRITTFKDATVARNDKAYFIESVRQPDLKMAREFKDGGMVNVVVNDADLNALFHYVASLK